jgi:hypothetical protein
MKPLEHDFRRLKIVLALAPPVSDMGLSAINNVHMSVASTRSDILILGPHNAMYLVFKSRNSWKRAA